MRYVDAVKNDLIFHALGKEIGWRRFQFDGGGSRELFEFLVGRQREAVVLKRFESERSVHGAAIKIEIAEDLCDALGDAAFAGTGWTINSNSEFAHESEILFQKPMML